MEIHSSTEGGFSVNTPSNWNAQTSHGDSLMPGTSSFGITFSSEPVNDKPTYKVYALSIGRQKYDRLHIEFTSKTLEDRAAEFAYMLAVHESNGGKFRIVPHGKTDHGVALWDFLIDADIGGQECKSIRLLISVGEHEWFQAAWVTPCQYSRKRKKEISAMVESLVVNDSWQGKTGTKE